MAAARRIGLRRSGGLVASRPLEVEVDLTSSEGDAVVIAELLESVDPAELGSRPPAPGPGADLFQYELTVDVDGRSERFVVDHRHASAELRLLVERLEQRALAAIRESRRGSPG